MPLDLIGLKRKKITSPNINILEQDIFEESFFDQVKKFHLTSLFTASQQIAHQKRVTKKTMSKV